MAACTHRVTTADSGTTPNTCGSFTPAVDDLLVGFVVVSATTSGATSTFVGSAGPSFVKIGVFTYNTGGSLCVIELWIATTLVASATSQTVTWGDTADQGSGSVITLYSVSGMSRVGTNAVRQSAGQTNQPALGTPAPVFGAACDTNNPTLGCVGNNSNPAGLTFPTSWTEGSDTGYNTPTTGSETVFRDSGFTGTTITWGGNSATAFGDLIVELDTSAAPAGWGPLLGQQRDRFVRARRGLDTTRYTPRQIRALADGYQQLKAA